ncbi:hypothetical protein DL93DRAFT_2092682 [Clavulina sp. PMI_390]|nr:hypothetical protein DL93DRAFT_2092682 [Clavulina sp. PMI_390]
MSLREPSPFQIAIWNAFIDPIGILVGCLISTILLGIVSAQSARYWEVFRQDKAFTIALVVSLLLAFVTVLYTHLVSAFGNAEVIQSNPLVDWRYLYAQAVGLVTTFVVLVTLTIPIIASGFFVFKSRILALSLDLIVLARTGLGFSQLYVLSEEAKRLGDMRIANLLIRVARIAPILIVLSDIIVASVLCGALLFARNGNPINDHAIHRLFNTLLPSSIIIILWQVGLGIGIWKENGSVATTFVVSSPLLFNVAYMATLHARSQVTSPDLTSLSNPIRWAFAKRKVEPWSTAITITHERVQQTEEGAVELETVSRLSLRPEEREVIEYYRAMRFSHSSVIASISPHSGRATSLHRASST